MVGILADNTGILTEVTKISATYQLQQKLQNTQNSNGKVDIERERAIKEEK